MAIVRQIDRRGEACTRADFAVTVWGVDTRGERFLQVARVRDISFSGALLSGLEADWRCGDVIGVLYQAKRARYRVIWVRYDDGGDKIQAALHRMAADVCPWGELLLPSQGPTTGRQARNIPGTCVDFATLVSSKPTPVD